ncbi:DUF1688-domain-containing protein [Macrolepiota fuliginosa MF-IS2]|uniref:DUF1688-domain-containing protein n=1 Tax=Macrolepiota fuliginosa MF-IS2 TaxID=1400762 RepID=A0A9P5X9V5_9AGAR|nr:DUF1688-domain-containing protein [Macrolepiota fuliginosa MF-IS2]
MNPLGELTPQTTAAYLRTLPAIRERCSRVYDLATQGKLQYFDYHPAKEVDAADFCLGIIKRDYNSDPANIQPHGRWRHLDAGTSRIEPLLAKWSSEQVDGKEKARRLIDLFLVSVLLDAGAGNLWKYTEPSTENVFNRSEGLGVASVHMFKNGFFSGVEGQPCRVDAAGLAKITAERTAAAMQVTDSNPMTGLEGRASLLFNLSKALSASPQFFGAEGRPGNIIDFLESQALPTSPPTIPLSALWTALLDGLNPIWPSRISLGGIALGDVWPCPTLAQTASGESDILVPFHKLTQWLTYSLVEIFQKVLGWNVQGLEDMTGLPEYRNGGLLVDLGVLTLKPNALSTDPKSGLPTAPPSHPAIVEWRAMTVIELDRIANLIREKLNLTPAQLSLAQVLEAATWKGGREIAKTKRPETGGPPIEIESDGTVF